MKKNTMGTITALLTGIGLGFLASSLIPDEKKREAKRMIKEKADQLKDIMGDTLNPDAVKEAMGDASSKAQLTFYKIRRELIDRLSQLQGGLSDIDRDKYKEVIKDILNTAVDEKRLDKGDMRALQAYLENDYRKIRDYVKKEEE
jgi:uncharacterized protein YpuA (DUF1002 family)